MKNILARQDENDVIYRFDKTNRVTIRTEKLEMCGGIEDLNCIKAFQNRGSEKIYSAGENYIVEDILSHYPTFTKVYKNNDYVFYMVTIIKCSKDDEFDEKRGKRLAQLKSNVQYDRLVRYAEIKLRSRLSKILAALLDKSVKDMHIADANRAKYDAERRK